MRLLNKVVLVCGCGHSGNTLVANMLAASSRTFVPLYETRAFMNGTARSLIELMRLRYFAARSRRDQIVEKTPNHVYRIPEIRRLGGARFVLMVRDGRDVAASIARRFGSVEVGIERWIRDNEIVKKEMNSPDTILVRYEDLIERTEQELRRVCDFTSIPFSRSMLDFHQQKRLWNGQTQIRKGTGEDGDEHRALRNWQVNQPLFDGRGRWRKELGEQDVAELQFGAGADLMRHFGYIV